MNGVKTNYSTPIYMADAGNKPAPSKATATERCITITEGKKTTQVRNFAADLKKIKIKKEELEYKEKTGILLTPEEKTLKENIDKLLAISINDLNSRFDIINSYVSDNEGKFRENISRIGSPAMVLVCSALGLVGAAFTKQIWVLPAGTALGYGAAIAITQHDMNAAYEKYPEAFAKLNEYTRIYREVIYAIDPGTKSDPTPGVKPDQTNLLFFITYKESAEK